MSTENKPKTGLQLGHYTLTVKLAEGIVSETWLAEHTFLESKEVCLKIFSDERFIRLLQHHKFLRTVKSPLHLPHMEDYDPNGAFPYLAQEVVSGKSLRQILRERKRLPPDMAFDFLQKIVISLKVLHEQNIAHLDLRPEHLLLDNSGNLRLLDYILGQVMSLTVCEYYREFTTKGVQLPRTVMRSLLYKSRQHRMGTDLSIRSDIFSLGIILFEMITGTYPTKKAEFPSQEVPNLPVIVDQVYSMCCNKGEDFYSNCDELLEEIQEHLTTAKQNVLITGSNNPPAQPPITTNPSTTIVTDTTPEILGVFPLREDAAVISVKTFAGSKTYVDSKNMTLLTKSFEDVKISRFRLLAFDFEGIDYINSSTIGFFVNFNDSIQGIGGVVVFFNVHNQVMTILSALGLEQVWQIVPTLADARKILLG